MGEKNVELPFEEQLEELNNQQNISTPGNNIDLLLDIPLEITIELGQTKMQIKDVLQLSKGSIIDLEKPVGEPVDIIVNNKPIAKGEVVIIDENIGVKVMDITAPARRLLEQMR